MENDFNPFLLSGYIEEKYFCNRKEETAILLRNIKNGINTTLFAIRRLGKTGLIQHLFNQLNKQNKYACIYIDIYSTKNLKDFTNILANTIYKRFPENKGIGKKIIEFIKLLRPTISYDSLTGNPEISIDLGQARDYEKTLKDIFTFLDNQNIKIVLAIDEFQQILEYPEKNVEALLRTHIQQLKNSNFIFCGSNQKMMHQIFNNAKRPFYASCTSMHLPAIENSDYANFITNLFKENGKKISIESIYFILDYTKTHTYYTQLLCNRLYGKGSKIITIEIVKSICIEILMENEFIYYQYRNMLTSPQWSLLKAIAKEGLVEKPHANEFIKKYNLGSTSTVSRSIESLMEKEMIYQIADDKINQYTVYDKFLMRWLQRK